MTALPRLRQDLALIESEPAYPGAPTWVLHDKLSNRFFRLQWQEIEILKCLQNDVPAITSVDELMHALNDRALLNIDKSNIATFLEFLSTHALLEIQNDEMRAQCLSRQSSLPKWNQWLFKHYLFFKVSLINPDPYLDHMLPATRWLFTSKTVWLLGIVSTLGILLTLRQWHAFAPAIAGLLTPQGMLIFLTALVIVKILHEFGHALAAKAMGCSVPSMGIAFMVFWPILYTDTTDAWRLSRRSQRVWIGLAGVVVELAIAAICLLLWHILPEGNLRNTFFLLATVTWAMTLLINLNPLMRFDGYFVFADLLGVENLQERAFALGRWWLRVRLMGLDEPAPEPPSTSLIVYCYCAWLYRLFLAMTIGLLIYTLFFKLLAIVLVLSYLLTSVIKPVAQELRYWWSNRDRIDNKSRGLLSLTILISVTILLLTPWSTSLHVPATLEVENAIPIYAGIDGRLKTLPVSGQKIAIGDPLIVIDSTDLVHEAALVNYEVKSLRWQLQNHSVAEGRLQSFMRAQHELLSVEQKKQALAAMQSRATVLAETDGIVTDLAPDLHPGNWVAKGTRIGTLIVNSPSARITAYVDERKLQRISPHASGVFISDGGSMPAVDAHVYTIEPAAITTLEQPYVASAHGGEVTTKPGAPLDVIGALYRVRMTTNNPPPSRVLRGTVMLEAQSASILGRLKNQVVGIWRREAGF